jgi:hypothetical protein
MSQQAMDSVKIRLIYDGIGPGTWCRDLRAFGVQDKAGVLFPVPRDRTARSSSTGRSKRSRMAQRCRY